MKPGIYYDLDEATYHGDRDSLSASGMKLLLKDPAIYRWQLDNPPPPRDHFDVGSAVHSLVLGAGPVLSPFPFDDWRSREARACREEARATGAIPLLAKDFDHVRAMADAVLYNSRARQVLTGGESEVSAFWHDPDWNVTRRARFDHLKGRVIGDLKTTTDSDPKSLPDIVARYGYDLSAAQYLDVANGLGLDVTAFGLVFVRKEPPHIVTVADLDADFLAIGRQKCRAALERYRDCRESGRWIGHDPDLIHTLTPPRWAFRDMETFA